MIRACAHDVNRALAPTGWALTEVTINATSGYVRIKAERRDHDQRSGVLVTLTRGCHRAPVSSQREITALRPGMFRSFWEVVDGGMLGRESHCGPRSALRALARYIDDNGSARAARGALRPLAGMLPDC